MQRNVKKQARYSRKWVWSQKKVGVFCEDLVVEKHMEAEVMRYFKLLGTSLRKKNEKEAEIIKCHELALYQFRGGRTKKKAIHWRFRISLCLYILAVTDSLLTQLYRLFSVKRKGEDYIFKHKCCRLFFSRYATDIRWMVEFHDVKQTKVWIHGSKITSNYESLRTFKKYVVHK